MGQRQLRRYVLPHPQSVNTRAYPTEVPEGDFLMLKNLDMAQNLGGFVTRPGYSRLVAQPGGVIRGGVRWYYGSVNSQFIVAADGGGAGGASLYRWDGTNFNVMAGFGALAGQRTVWNFPFSQDLLFILNGSDTVRRWDGTNGRVAGFAVPAAALSAAAGAAGVLTGAYQYVFTNVYDSVAAREGSASAQSTVVNPASQQVNLTGILVGPTGVTSRNVYRTKAGGTLFYFLTTINDNTTTVFTDNVADSALGTNQAPTDNNAPPAGAQFGLFWRGRFVVANTPTNPQRVFFSAIVNTEKSPGGGGLSLHGNGIEIFPSSHFIDVGDDNTPITGLAVLMDQLIVFKQQRIYCIQGDDAVDMVAWVAQGETGCIAPKSIQNVGNSLMFLGRVDGVPTIYAFDGVQAQPLSTPIEPTLKANIDSLGFTDYLSLTGQPCSFKYRGMYGLCYATSIANQTAEVAVLDMRPPQPRWQYWSIGGATGIPTSFIPWNGPGDKGQLFYGDFVFGSVYQVDVGSQDVAGASLTNVSTTITTKPMDLGAPGIWKQIHRVEVEGLAVAGTTVEVDRAYNRNGTYLIGSVLPMSAPVDDKLYLNLARAVQDCAGADDTQANPEQGELLQLNITMTSSATGRAEISKIIVWFSIEPASETRRPA